MGIECRLDDQRTIELLQCLKHDDTTTRVLAERAMNNRLEGGCQVPIAGYSVLEGDQIWLRGLVGEPDGTKVVRHEVRGPREQAEALGYELGDVLLQQGAREILDRLYNQADS